MIGDHRSAPAYAPFPQSDDEGYKDSGYGQTRKRSTMKTALSIAVSGVLVIAMVIYCYDHDEKESINDILRSCDADVTNPYLPFFPDALRVKVGEIRACLKPIYLWWAEHITLGRLFPKNLLIVPTAKQALNRDNSEEMTTRLWVTWPIAAAIMGVGLLSIFLFWVVLNKVGPRLLKMHLNRRLQGLPSQLDLNTTTLTELAATGETIGRFENCFVQFYLADAGSLTETCKNILFGFYLTWLIVLLLLLTNIAVDETLLLGSFGPAAECFLVWLVLDLALTIAMYASMLFRFRGKDMAFSGIVADIVMGYIPILGPRTDFAKDFFLSALAFALKQCSVVAWQTNLALVVAWTSLISAILPIIVGLAQGSFGEYRKEFVPVLDMSPDQSIEKTDQGDDAESSMSLMSRIFHVARSGSRIRTFVLSHTISKMIPFSTDARFDMILFEDILQALCGLALLLGFGGSFAAWLSVAVAVGKMVTNRVLHSLVPGLIPHYRPTDRAFELLVLSYNDYNLANGRELPEEMTFFELAFKHKLPIALRSLLRQGLHCTLPEKYHIPSEAVGCDRVFLEDMSSTNTTAYLNVTEIEIGESNNIGADGWAHIKSMANVTTLTIGAYNDIGADGCAHIQSMANVTTLTIGDKNYIDARGCAHIKSMANLTTLTIDGNYIDAHGCAQIKSMANLTTLTIHNSKIGADGCAHIKSMANLTTLTIDGNKIGADGCAHIKSMANLTTLSIDDNGIRADGCAHIKSMANLTTLTIGGNYIDADGCAHIKSMANLTTLTIHIGKIGAEGCAHIKSMANLTTLTIGPNGIGADGCAHIKSMANLTTLMLAGFNGIGADGCAHIKSMTNLKKLSIETFQNKIDTEARDHLNSMVNLVELELPEFRSRS